MIPFRLIDTSCGPPVSSALLCAIVFLWSLQDCCTKAASLNHFKQGADVGRWPCSIISETLVMEGNFHRIYQSLFACKCCSKQTKKGVYKEKLGQQRSKGVVLIKCDRNTKTADAALLASIKGHAAYSWICGYFQPSSFFLSINRSATVKPHHKNLGLDA